MTAAKVTRDELLARFKFGFGFRFGFGFAGNRGKWLQSRVSSSFSSLFPPHRNLLAAWRRLLLGSCLHACYAYLLTNKYMNIYVYIDLYACYCCCSGSVCCLLPPAAGCPASWHSRKGGGLASAAMSAAARYWQPWQRICCRVTPALVIPTRAPSVHPSLSPSARCCCLLLLRVD